MERRCYNIPAFHCVQLKKLDELLVRFWEVEELSSMPYLSEDKLECENHFKRTHSRLPDGRYLVRIPFKREPPIEIGSSRAIALNSLEKSEQRLQKNPHLCYNYHEFLSEYLNLGHMEIAPTLSTGFTPVDLPHHPVIKEDSCTTRVRIVFHASSPTTNGTSLNDHMHIGQKLQQDLAFILLRWRRFCFTYMTDIEKMFRQIKIHPDDTAYQRILWRSSSQHNVSEYRLTTVTYGMAAAPFLANRVLRQLAQDECSKFPLATAILEKDTYVDDIFFGADNVEDLEVLRKQLLALLNCGGFSLRKWASNDDTLLRNLSEEFHDDSLVHPLNNEGGVKVLGIAWRPVPDSFHFCVTEPKIIIVTKRQVLSHIARLFDPLGWVAPVLIQAKILMQEIWLQKIGWDDELPPELLQRWKMYCSELPSLTNIAIPRWTGQTSNATSEIHGFADASSRAYAAVVYLRVSELSSPPSITLLMSKTKVAPLKTLSTPKLELNAAFLLTKVVSAVCTYMNLPDAPVHCWSDSTVTLDCASRDLSALELQEHPLWFLGSSWLKSDPSKWPKRPTIYDSSVELERRKPMTHNAVIESSEWELPMQFSSWPKLIRVTAYVLRFVKLCRKSTPDTLNRTPISADEICFA